MVSTFGEMCWLLRNVVSLTVSSGAGSRVVVPSALICTVYWGICQPIEEDGRAERNEVEDGGRGLGHVHEHTALALAPASFSAA